MIDNIFEFAYMVSVYSLASDLFNYFFLPFLAISILAAIISVIKYIILWRS